MPYFVTQKSIDLFTKQEVFTDVEVKTRGEIMMEDYNNTLHFEMLTMLEMAKQEILPACLKYTKLDVYKRQVLSVTVLPPVFGPVMTSVSYSPPSIMSFATTFSLSISG